MKRVLRKDLIRASTTALLLHATLFALLWEFQAGWFARPESTCLAPVIAVDLVAGWPATAGSGQQNCERPSGQRISKKTDKRLTGGETTSSKAMSLTPSAQASLAVNETEGDRVQAAAVEMVPAEGAGPITLSAEHSGLSGPASSGPAVEGQLPGRAGRGGTGGFTSGSNAVMDSRPPAYGDRPEPEYPAAAVRRGYQGTTLLRVRVLEDGRVEVVEIKESSGYRILDEAAMKAVRPWHFTPALMAGKPVASWVLVPIAFKLTGNMPLKSVTAQPTESVRMSAVPAK
jgi:TonB family protein